MGSQYAVFCSAELACTHAGPFANIGPLTDSDEDLRP